MSASVQQAAADSRFARRAPDYRSAFHFPVFHFPVFHFPVGHLAAGGPLTQTFKAGSIGEGKAVLGCLGLKPIWNLDPPI